MGQKSLANVLSVLQRGGVQPHKPCLLPRPTTRMREEIQASLNSSPEAQSQHQALLTKYLLVGGPALLCVSAVLRKRAQSIFLTALTTHPSHPLSTSSKCWREGNANGSHTLGMLVLQHGDFEVKHTGAPTQENVWYKHFDSPGRGA